MIADVIALVLSACSTIISIIALRSNIKTGNEQIRIGAIQSTLQEKQVEIRQLQMGLQEKQVEISKLQSILQEKQVTISQMQIDFQNKVELYFIVVLRQHSNGFAVPTITIRNAGNNVVYLTKYEFNGHEYPQNNYVLPPMATCMDASYYIDLPVDGTTHVSLKLEFEDWQRQKWQTKGYADLRNGLWELTYSPCEKGKVQGA